MTVLTHGFKIDQAKCSGRMRCMRSCPTQAIRVRNGKAQLITELCIDCGSCLGACPSKAISARTISLADLDPFKFKVAVASPAIFTQFGMSATPAQVGQALLGLGFDAVWQYAVDIELTNRAIIDCVNKWTGSFPLIATFCPVVVRLVQVAYPTMVDQLIPLEAPREIAGREVKRKYSQQLDLKEEEIAAIYITPCIARSIAIIQPAIPTKSYLDGALGISQIYNEVLYRLYTNAKKPGNDACEGLPESGELCYWGRPEGEFPNLPRENYLALTGLADIIRVFNDVEMGRLKHIKFLECHACPGGCIGGNLTVENHYVARSKNLQLKASMLNPTVEFEREVARRFGSEDFSIRISFKPRALSNDVLDLRERVRRSKRAEEILRSLPLLDCGLCGTPSCKNYADDVASGRSEAGDCVFLSRNRIDLLRETYKRNQTGR